MPKLMNAIAAAAVAGLIWSVAHSQDGEATNPKQAVAAGDSIVYVILYRPGPAWSHGKPMSEQGLRPHGAYLKQLLADGKLKAAGPWLETSGGIVLTGARSREEAWALVEKDPAFTSGLFVGEVRSMVLRFSDGSLREPE